jgi:hypothetical protein
MIRSKFSFLSVYLVFFFIVGLFSLGVYFLTHAGLVLHNRFGSTNGPLIPGAILTLGMLTLLYFLLKGITVITIEKDRLSVRNLFFRRTLLKSEIKSIDLLGRGSFFIANNSGESMTIEMKDGKKLSFPDGVYRNVSEMKQTLQDWYGDILLPLPARRRKAKELPIHAAPEDIGRSQKFSGNYITSLNGMLFYGISLVFVRMDFSILSSPMALHWEILLIITPLSLVYFAFGIQLFYFEISDECLGIRNHLFFWYKKIYRLEDIQGAILESPFRRSYSLRIKTNNFESNTYGAGSLRRDDWKALARKLRSLSIHFRSEIPLDDQ